MRIQGLLLDVEGVLVADKRYRAVKGAPEFIRVCRERNLRLRLVTNNTTDPKPALIQKLTRAGFDFTPDELHTCIGAAVNRLHTIGATRCLVLGTPALRRMFADEGFTVTERGHVDAVVVGLDTDLTYERLRLACDAVLRFDAALIALHRNRLYPDDQGRRSPSVGPIVEAIAYATQVAPEVVGKPNPAIFEQALVDLGLATDAALMVSDDPFSDLVGAKQLGIGTAFVLTGKYSDPAVVDKIAPAERPDVIVDQLEDLLSGDCLAG
jgi:4-nitrophenyl phosphatase